MNKFKVGDKIIVKEKFWEIKSYIFIYGGMKKLAGRTLEVEYIDSDGDVGTKQDESNDDTRWIWDKDWLEPTLRTIDDVREDDLITDGDVFRRVLGRAGKAVFMTCNWRKGEEERTDASGTYSIQDIKDDNFTIVNETPPAEKLELTLDQIA